VPKVANPVPSNEQPRENREVFFEDTGWKTVPIYLRENLAAGSKLDGPCIVEEPICTVLIPPDFSGVIDEYKNIEITAKGEHEL
jgi:N-methylhydantoinase A/oxoprolinase/acetone carboxylase beta subunit